jgi:alkylation response protein AidB-like acyl-CoA dehydrogenase
VAAAQDLAESAEHAELRATVSRIAGKFGGSYYAAKAQARQSCDELWQALAQAGFVGTHGGNGLSSEFGLVPLWGLARLLRIAPVNREMVLNYVAQHSLGLPRSY